MSFIRKLVTNMIGLLIVIVVLFLVAPEIMAQAGQIFGGLIGPAILILFFVAAALPSKRRRYRR